MTTPEQFSLWQTRAQAQTELILERLLPQTNTVPEHLHEAMRYATLCGGKRLRPLLVFATAQLGGADQTFVEHVAAAVECIHVYSLVHDDMPEMDNDNMRRGKPTCHIAYDQATALLVGDALQTMAFDLLSHPSKIQPARQINIIQTLAKASGSLGMAGGQAIDLANVGKNLSRQALEHMHSLKTGALICAAVRMGALCCVDITDNDLTQLSIYAQKLGLAFQVIDDVLDCEQDSQTLGKTAGKDVEQDKPTYVRLMGLQEAREYADSLISEAFSAIGHFDEKADKLRALAVFVTQRQS